MTAGEFEQRIARIEEILGGNVASVRWNARVPDPDNPGQLRQVDVLIERENLRTFVECRHHAAPQDVTWIEELLGRRQSLRADAMIAVSSSGFTEGAMRKAEALGIVARAFRDVTAYEVRHWGSGTRVWVECVEICDARVNVVLPPLFVRFSAGRGDPSLLTSEGKPWPIDHVFKTLADKVSETDEREGTVRLQVLTKNLTIRNRSIDELVIEASYRKINIGLLLPSVSVYGKYGGDLLDDSVVVESVPGSEFDVVHAPDGVRYVVDFSVVGLPPNCIGRSIIFDFGRPVPIRSVEVVGAIAASLKPTKVAYVLDYVLKDSAQHHARLNMSDRGLIILPNRPGRVTRTARSRTAPRE